MAATVANSLTRISSGPQDDRLVAPMGNPSVQQFVKVLRKTTRWAAQWRRVDFDGQANFGQRVSITVPRAAELLSGVTLVVSMPDIYAPQIAARLGLPAGTTFLGPTFGWTNALGHALLDRVELEIGGAIVDTIDGRLLEVLDELYEPVETLKAKNRLIARAATGFTQQTWGHSPTPLQVFVPLPFWFSQPNKLSHALPIDAIQVDAVKIHVTFRPVTALYYTDARIDNRTVGLTDIDELTNGQMMPLAGSPFWVQDNTAADMVYFMNRTMPYGGVKGRVLPSAQMPTRLDMGDAYMMLEYVSLEEPEAIALRTSELTYFVEQHNAVVPQATQGRNEMRVSLPIANLTKEILWVFQRPEALTYNAWFLFTRDLGPYTFPRLAADQTIQNPVNPTTLPWWPNAELQPTVTNRWRILPAFRDARSEPMVGATLLYNSYERFEFKGMPSLFRALIPTQKATKSAVHDRYVYQWHFGLPMAGARGDVYEPRGAANWDKIPRREMYFTLAPERGCAAPPDMTAYIWTTSWNMLKVFGGRAGMLFDT